MMTARENITVQSAAILWRILHFTSHALQSATMLRVVLFRKRNAEHIAMVGIVVGKLLVSDLRRSKNYDSMSICLR